MERGQAVVGHRIGPREFALIMISTGLAALLLATVQHRQSMIALAAAYGSQPRSVAAVVATLVSLMGLVAFGATLFHV